LAAALNPGEGGLILWARAYNAAVWTDGVTKTLFDLFMDGSNYLRFQYQGGAAKTLSMYYAAGGALVSGVDANCYPLDWVCLGMTWSKSADGAEFYHNGQKFGTVSGLGTWAGSATRASIGYQNVSNFWNGWLTDVLLVNRRITALEMKQAAMFSPLVKVKTLAILGDSLSAKTSVARFPEMLQSEYSRGPLALINHAYGGASILADLDGERLAAAADDADLILIELGGNDDNAGDMNALRLKVESNLAALRLSNPRAGLYYMNVTPGWTDGTGATELVKNNIRAAIAAACANQGVTCWDSASAPWITAADTLDGRHLNASGAAKVVAQILSRLP